MASQFKSYLLGATKALAKDLPDSWPEEQSGADGRLATGVKISELKKLLQLLAPDRPGRKSEGD